MGQKTAKPGEKEKKTQQTRKSGEKQQYIRDQKLTSGASYTQRHDTQRSEYDLWSFK